MELRYSAPESCPDVEQLRGEVGARLGYDPFLAPAPRILDIAIHQAAPKGLTADISLLRNGEVIGERTLQEEGGDCSLLADDVFLAVAIAIDPLTPPVPPTGDRLVWMEPKVVVRTAPEPETKAKASANKSEPPPTQKPVAERKGKESASFEAKPKTLRLSNVEGLLLNRAPYFEGLVVESSLGLGVHFNGSPNGEALTRSSMSAGVRWRYVSVHLEGWGLTIGEKDLGSATFFSGINALDSVVCGHAYMVMGCAKVGGGTLYAWSQGLVGSRFDVSPYFHTGLRAGLEWTVLPFLRLRGLVDLDAPLGSYVIEDPNSDVVFWKVPGIQGSAGIHAVGVF